MRYGFLSLCLGLVLAGGPAVGGVLPPHPIGAGPSYQPAAVARVVEQARPVGPMTCTRHESRRSGVHLELFARRQVVIVPAGIGIAPPLVRSGAFVRGGRCSYPLRTRAPTGVIEVAAGPGRTLGDLFRLWGQPLSAHRLLTFRTLPGETVESFLAGRRWRRDPRLIPLAPGAQIVLEIGGHVEPHATFLFPKGLS